ncbi:unnamed protein product [Caretta caretta]
MEQLVVNLVNVYAPASGLEWLHFYQQVSTFLGSLDPHKCLDLGRDFNTTLEERDRLGTKQCPSATDVLWEIANHHSLVDVWCDTIWRTSRRSPLSGWKPISRTTPGWTTSTCHASTFRRATPPASIQSCFLITI